MSREEIIRALALRHIVPLTLDPKTPYEINAVKTLERFGNDVIDAVIASSPKSQIPYRNDNEDGRFGVD